QAQELDVKPDTGDRFLARVTGEVEESIIYKAGFRSLGEGEVVEFESKPSDKGIEATFVCGVGGAECRGSDRRPMSRKKFRKISNAKLVGGCQSSLVARHPSYSDTPPPTATLLYLGIIM
ncbi:hypothetical protein BaRGS_00008636, partial [Batillaria attramentaria]